MMNETIAIKVAKLAGQCSDAFSLYAGYGMNKGEYIRFPQGVQLSERRNDKGRVTNAVYIYADGSKLTYSYNESRGYDLR